MKADATRFFRLAALLAILMSSGSMAAEIKVLCMTPMQDAMKELAPMFEKSSGHKLALRYEVTNVLIRGIEAGEAFDATILLPKQIESLVTKGRIAAGTATEIARSPLGVGVRAGAPKPDISTVAALKASLQAAKSIAYSKEGQSGVAFKSILERLGLTSELQPKLVATPSSEFATVVPSGKAEMIIVPISVIMAPGMDLVGPVPAELQSYFQYTAAIAQNAGDTAAAKAFVDFLRSPAVAPILKTKGMEPATLN